MFVFAVSEEIFVLFWVIAQILLIGPVVPQPFVEVLVVLLVVAPIL